MNVLLPYAYCTPHDEIDVLHSIRMVTSGLFGSMVSAIRPLAVSVLPPAFAGLGALVLFAGAHACSSRSLKNRVISKAFAFLGGALLATTLVTHAVGVLHICSLVGGGMLLNPCAGVLLMIALLAHSIGMPYASWLFFVLLLAECGGEREMAVEIAVQDKDEGIRKAGLQEYDNLIFDSFWVSEASYSRVATIAHSAMQGLYPEVGVLLYGKLLEKGQAIESALQAATIAVQSEDVKIQIAGFKLCEKLVESEQEFPAVVRAAWNAVQSADRRVRVAVLELHEKFVDKGLELTAVARIAAVAMLSQDESVREKGAALCKKVLATEQGINSAAKVAADFMCKKTGVSSAAGLMLYKQLVEGGQEYAAAARAAEGAMESSNWSIHQLGFELYEMLLARQKGYESAARAAATIVERWGKADERGLKLYGLLIEKGALQRKGYDEAMKAVDQAIPNLGASRYHRKVCLAAIMVCIKLVKKGKVNGSDAFRVARRAGVLCKQSSCIQKNVLELIGELLCRGEVFNLITSGKEDFIKSVARECAKLNVFTTLKKLLEHLQTDEVFEVFSDVTVASYLLTQPENVYSDYEARIKNYIKTLPEGADLLPFLPFLEREQIVAISEQFTTEPTITVENEATGSISAILIQLNGNADSLGLDDAIAYLVPRLEKISPVELAQGVKAGPEEVGEILAKHCEMLTFYQQRVVIPLLKERHFQAVFEKKPFHEWSQFICIMTKEQRTTLFGGELPLTTNKVRICAATMPMLERDVTLLERIMQNLPEEEEVLRTKMEKKCSHLKLTEKRLEGLKTAPPEEPIIPDRYRDQVMQVVMEAPVNIGSAEHPYYIDKSTLDRLFEGGACQHPLTREPLNSSYPVDEKLQYEIAGWIQTEAGKRALEHGEADCGGSGE